MAMDLGGFVVQGSRPPSVQSSHSYRPGSGQGRHHGYHTVAYQSSVDETLFSPHHSTKIHEPVAEFKAPWEYPKPKPMGHTFGESKVKIKVKDDKSKTKPKTRPLFWAPMTGTAIHTYKKKENNNGVSSSNNSQQFWNGRDHFRHLKHTSTFVDESLFGKKLEEPAFEAPWNEKKEKFNLAIGSTKSYRPKTALGIYKHREAIGGGSKAVPVWRP